MLNTEKIERRESNSTEYVDPYEGDFDFPVLRVIPNENSAHNGPKAFIKLNSNAMEALDILDKERLAIVRNYADTDIVLGKTIEKKIEKSKQDGTYNTVRPRSLNTGRIYSQKMIDIIRDQFSDSLNFNEVVDFKLEMYSDGVYVLKPLSDEVFITDHNNAKLENPVQVN